MNITGWNTSTLSITPPASYSGTLTLQVTATAAELVGGSTASVSQSMTVQVNAIAQVPTLTLNPPTTSVSQTVISTSWPTVCNTGCGPTIVTSSQFGGWSVMPAACGKNAAFEVWANGDQAKNAQGQNETLEDASGAGQEWLGLSNGVSSSYQSPGVEQTINTVANATYTFSLDYAGQLGLASANTAIGVYLDGTLVGTYSNASVNSLNWQSLSYSFKGDGNSHTLSVQLINGTNTSTARGAMINAMTLIETEPESASTVYGFAGSPIALPQISDQLAAGDPGLLETTLVGLPVGATIADGKNTATITSATTPLIVTGWNLAKLTVTVPQSQSQGGCGGSSSNTLNLQVVATSVEPGNGSMASIAKDVTVQLLSGQPVATPAGVNPYVSYVNSASLTQTSKAITNPIVIASALVPVSSSYAITLPITSPVNSGTLGADDDLDASLESLLESLSQSVGTALWNELKS